MKTVVYWRCFHCGETFTKAQEAHAREHFGAREGDEPVCKMRVAGEGHILTALRKAHDELAGYRADDTNLVRALHSQAADYEDRVRLEEETGYARGLKGYADDMKRFVPYVEAVVLQLEDEVDIEMGHTLAQIAIARQLQEGRDLLKELGKL